MAENNAPTPPGSPEVTGYLAGNWLSFDRPALIVNPQARHGDLLAWCWGELASMRAAADALLGQSDGISTGDFSAIILHRLESLERVLGHVVDQMHLTTQTKASAMLSSLGDIQ